MLEDQGLSRNGANIVAGVDVDEGATRQTRATRRKRTTANLTPFNGLPIIYGVVGYMAFFSVVMIVAALSISGVGLWPLVLVALVCALGIRFVRGGTSRRG